MKEDVTFWFTKDLIGRVLWKLVAMKNFDKLIVETVKSSECLTSDYARILNLFMTDI